MPSNFQPYKPVSPTDQVAQFQNQQLGGLMTGTGAEVGDRNTPLDRDPVTQARQAPTVSVGNTEVAQRSARVGDSLVSLSQQNMLNSMKAIKTKEDAKKKAAEEAARQANSGSGVIIDPTYKPNANISATRNSIMSEASSYLGNPYVFGGTTHKGIDCSGLVMAVYNKFGFNISQHSSTWQGANIPGVRTNVNNLKPGDIVSWQHGGHIAIYAGDGYIIQAANPQQGVIKSRLVDQVGYTPDSVYGIALRLPGE